MIELQPQLANSTRRNLFLNDLCGTVTQQDIAGGLLPSHLEPAFDVVLLNPSFYLPHKHTSSRHEERRLAQIESSASLSHFIAAARAACDPHNAFIALIHDVTECERIGDAQRSNQVSVTALRERSGASEIPDVVIAIVHFRGHSLLESTETSMIV